MLLTDRCPRAPVKKTTCAAGLLAHTFLALTTLAHLTTSLCRALSLSLARDGRG